MPDDSAEDTIPLSGNHFTMEKAKPNWYYGRGSVTIQFLISLFTNFLLLTNLLLSFATSCIMLFQHCAIFISYFALKISDT